jgi:hypothetical protein
MAKRQHRREPPRHPKPAVSTAEELAVKLRAGRNQVYEALAAGKIKGAFRLNRKWIIPNAAIDRLLSGEITI